MQVDIQVVAGFVRPDDNPIDERANAAHRLFLRFLVCEAFNELRNSGAVALTNPRLDQLRFNVHPGQLGLNGVPFVDG